MNKTNISPLAVVSPKAQLAEGVQVGPFVVIEDDVTVGNNTIIETGAILKDGTRIGCDCHIHPYAVIGGIPQDLKFKGEQTTAEIGDRTTIREYVTINRGTASRGYTKVGSDCLIMAYAHIAHDCSLSDHVIVGNGSQIAGEVVIDEYAILSGVVLVHQFVRISKHAMVQGGSKITKDIPPFTLVGRDPVAYCGINIVGLRRRNFTNEQIFAINEVYRLIYSAGYNTTEAISVIRRDCAESVERDFIVQFIETSQRGVVRGSMD